MLDNPMAPVTLEVRYNRYETWDTDVDAPGMVKIYSMLGPTAVAAPPGSKRRQPTSVREAIDRAAGKSPEQIRQEGHLIVLRYPFKTIEAASHAERRIRNIANKGYSVRATVLPKRGAVQRGKKRRMVVS